MSSTAEKVLRHAPCSVLTVRAGTRIPHNGRFRKILGQIDFSESAGYGLDGARAIRADDQSTLYLVHVVDPAPPMYLAGNVSSYFELDPDLKNRIEANLRTWSGDIPASKIVITEGNPANEVARLSEELGVDLIAMSTKGLTGAEHLLVGSVTERVGRFEPVPVLAIRWGLAVLGCVLSATELATEDGVVTAQGRSSGTKSSGRIARARLSITIASRSRPVRLRRSA